MRLQTLVLFLSLCAPAWAGVLVSFHITATGGAPIPIANSISDTQSQIVTALDWASARWFCAYNNTSSLVAFNLDGSATTAPTGDLKDIYVPRQTGRCTRTKFRATIYLRSASGSTITSGDVFGDVTTDAPKGN